jgi:hypothetical protein
MTTRCVENEIQRELAIRLLGERKLPFTIEVLDGRRRSTEQNRLQRLWMNEIAEQLPDRTPEEWRAYCKLTIGVPILRAENELFCEKYDRHIKPMSYEAKLDLMGAALDFPVTRFMTVAQKTKYLDGIQRHFAEQGVILTQPEDKQGAGQAG